MDSDVSPAFQVHKLDGSGTTIFAEHPSGLYLYDASSNSSPPIANHSNATVIAYSCLQTVVDNKSKFTARQVAAADDARKLYCLLGRPSLPRFITALQDNHILNCPIIVDYARQAELIYGQDVAFLRPVLMNYIFRLPTPDSLGFLRKLGFPQWICESEVVWSRKNISRPTPLIIDSDTGYEKIFCRNDRNT